MKFSIVTASFQPGVKLIKTINSILDQTFEDYEVVIKDGMSKDESLQLLEADDRVSQQIQSGRIQIIRQADKSVYDAMNQAYAYTKGEYILYLNCGDIFYDNQVLQKVAEEIDRHSVNGENGAVFYGNTFCSRTGVLVHSSPKITGFTCYRNIPCHQSCFYKRELIGEKPYDTGLKIRADYDHFLWCFYEKKAAFYYVDMVISDYEGGGISESKENRKTDQKEHEIIIRRYMGKMEIAKYKLIMLATLAPLRRFIAESTMLSGVYHKLKNMLYR